MAVCRTRQVAGAQPNSFIYYDSDGNISTVTGFYRNASSTKTDGFDVELRHKMNLGEAGNLSAQFNYTTSGQVRAHRSGRQHAEYAGTHGPIVLSAGGGTPKDRRPSR